MKVPLIIAAVTASLVVSGTAIAIVRHISSIQVNYPTGPIAYKFSHCYASNAEHPLKVRSVQGKEFTFWEAEANFIGSDGGPQLFHFKTKPSNGKEPFVCEWLNRNTDAIRLDYLPESVAVDFATQYYTPMLDECKKANAKRKELDTYCQQDMKFGLKGAQLYQEEAIALQRLGIDVDGIPDHKILESK